jgi:UDP-N-acetylglucosamine/UDP-N-acetyl-alpha-D-glucosaminouronate 4-epimerase
MSEYLVTGGAGFIGSHIVEGLLARGDSVRVLDNFATGRRENLAAFEDSITIIEGDLNDPDALARAVDGVEVIFHEAALPSVPRSVSDPIGSNKANVDGTVALLWAAHNAKVRRVVYAASSSAYGNCKESPKVETILPSTLSPYAAAKYAGEMYMRAFYECYGLETVCLRYFNVFGPRQNPKSQYAAAIPLFITAIMEDRSPMIYGDGEQSRDFTFVKNVVHANLLAADAQDAPGKMFNCGCGGSVTVNEVIALINQALGKDIPSEFVPTRVGDVKHSCADISLARATFGYEPVVAFEDGLKLTIDYLVAGGK